MRNLSSVQWAVEVEQCALFVDSDPIKEAMTGTGAELRRLAQRVAELEAAARGTLDFIREETNGLEPDHPLTVMRVALEKALGDA